MSTFNLFPVSFSFYRFLFVYFCSSFFTKQYFSVFESTSIIFFTSLAPNSLYAMQNISQPIIFKKLHLVYNCQHRKIKDSKFQSSWIWSSRRHLNYLFDKDQNNLQYSNYNYILSVVLSRNVFWPSVLLFRGRSSCSAFCLCRG